MPTREGGSSHGIAMCSMHLMLNISVKVTSGPIIFALNRTTGQTGHDRSSIVAICHCPLCSPASCVLASTTLVPSHWVLPLLRTPHLLFRADIMVHTTPAACSPETHTGPLSRTGRDSMRLSTGDSSRPLHWQDPVTAIRTTLKRVTS